ncbi:MAG: aminotransferase class I/II-fold pyridoxal phosphate-dependent enzyme, partial [Sedimentisphaerales bacterium]|nr:aminotransferase class I/II-fold pyridoxal phosphate-dependent enzyme [Sedimentisphaerales bacterium]
MSENGYERRINELKRRGLWRQLSTVESVAGRTAIIQGRETVVFGSNNYLGLANHPHIIEAIKQGLDAWGFGAGASRLLCGNTAAHERLQHRLAGLLHRPAALVFPSGYQTNIAVLSSLAGPGDLVILDKLSHASLIDGAGASGATVRTFGHRQPDRLRRLLDRGGFRNAIIVTDSLFSMDGDLADLAELVEIKRRYDALLLVDEAHAFGCLGPDGAGWAAALGLLDAIDVVVVTFSKALGGVGGAVACSRTVA